MLWSHQGNISWKPEGFRLQRWNTSESKRNGEFHGKKNTPWVIKEEAEIPKGERILSTLVSLRNKQGDCLEAFYSKAIWRAFLRVDELRTILNVSSNQSVPGLETSNWTNPLAVPRDLSGGCFPLLLLIHPEKWSCTWASHWVFLSSTKAATPSETKDKHEN